MREALSYLFKMELQMHYTTAAGEDRGRQYTRYTSKCIEPPSREASCATCTSKGIALVSLDRDRLVLGRPRVKVSLGRAGLGRGASAGTLPRQSISLKTHPGTHPYDHHHQPFSPPMLLNNADADGHSDARTVIF